MWISLSLIKHLKTYSSMGIFFGWIIFSFVVGFIGAGRKIGFFGSFLLSLLLSPLIGLIIALNSKSKEQEDFEQRTIELQRKQLHASEQATVGQSVSDEMRKLRRLLDDGLITETEYEEQRKKLLSS